MLINSNKCRKEHDVDSYTIENLPPLLSARHYCADGLWGETKDGCPVYWQIAAQEDYAGRLEAGEGLDRQMAATVYAMDRLDFILRDISMKKGSVVDKMAIVCDLKGLSLYQCTPFNFGIYNKRLGSIVFVCVCGATADLNNLYFHFFFSHL
jgi:hypothetical protein